MQKNIKVTIHVDEQTPCHKHLHQGFAAPPPHPRPAHSVLPETSTVVVPSLRASVRKPTWPGEAPTAPLTPLVNGSGNSVDDDVAGIDNSIETEIGRGVLEESEKPQRPKSMVAKRLLKNVHKRRSSLSHSRSGSFAGDMLDGRSSRSNLYSLSAHSSGPGRSPTNAEVSSVGDDDLSDDGNVSSDGEMVMGKFEGLKWGEMVQFKLPAEDEVRASRMLSLI